MALVLQNANGNVVGANAYGIAADFLTYHSDRGNTIPGSPSTPQVEQAIIRATTYVDVRFRYIGDKLNPSIQTTQWPRLNAVDNNDYLVQGIPLAVVMATYEYALRSISASLLPDPTRDETGAIVTMISERVGTLAQTRQFSAGGQYDNPKYPLADMILTAAGLVLQGRRTIRT